MLSYDLFQLIQVERERRYLCEKWELELELYSGQEITVSPCTQSVWPDPSVRAEHVTERDSLSVSLSHVALPDWQNTKGQLNIYFIHDKYPVQSGANIKYTKLKLARLFSQFKLIFSPISLRAARISTNIHPMTAVGCTRPGEFVCTFLSLLTE